MEYTSTVFQQHGDWYGAIRWRENGQGRRKTKKLDARTKTEARRKLNAWIANLDIEQVLESSTRLEDYMRAFHRQKKATGMIEEATYYGYGIYVRYINPYIGNVQMQNLTRPLCQRWINRLAEQFSPATVRKAYAMVKDCTNYAIERGDLAHDPFVGIRLPKMKRNRPNSLDAENRAKLKEYLSMCATSPTKVGIMLALWCGMRQGEICALRWSDIDFASSTITVAHALGRAGGKYVYKSTKTDQVRTVPMTPLVKKELERLKDMARRQFAELEAEFDTHSYVLGDVDGSFMHPGRLSKNWSSVNTMLGLQGVEDRTVTFHDLRHTFATAAIAGGVDVKTVSSILGHADTSMTLNVYAAADPDAKRAAAVAIDGII